MTTAIDPELQDYNYYLAEFLKDCQERGISRVSSSTYKSHLQTISYYDTFALKIALKWHYYATN
jgi:hypothetical protein